MAENICHLVLARLPDGVPGPKGLHGSPTAVMEYDNAKGWLVGQEHNGMATMFVMMNNARLGVGVQGLGIAEMATQKAIAFAMDRKQGRSPIEGGTIAIDMATATGDADWNARAAFLTPISKAFGTDAGLDVANLGVQVHGGMGFIEETGAAQFMRDVRVTSIYEGTNGIQAMDMVGRKLMDGGKAAYALIDEIAETLEGDVVSAALTQATDWMVKAEMNDRFAGATSYLRAFALGLGAHYLEKAASVDPARKPLSDFYAAHFARSIH